jgi:hypothetical protein
MHTAEEFIQGYKELPQKERLKVILYLEDELDLEALREDICIAEKRYKNIVDGNEKTISANEL